MTGFEYEYVKIEQEGKEDFKKNVYSVGLFPYLQDESGEGFGESLAIARFMCNSKVEAGLYGATTYETAQIDEVIERHFFNFNMSMLKVILPVFGYAAISDENNKDCNKRMKDYLRSLDETLKDKQYFVGDKLSLADVYVASTLNIFFATVLDAGFRKAIPNLTKWYESVRNHEEIVAVLGKPRYCGKALKPKLEE